MTNVESIHGRSSRSSAAESYIREGEAGGKPRPYFGLQKTKEIAVDLSGSLRESHREMEIYLARHGEAKSDKDDAARPLSDNGRSDVERVALAAMRAGVRPALIRHSERVRAEQTAGIFAKTFGLNGSVASMTGLDPNDNPAAAGQFIDRLTEPAMLVGHLPHLPLLVSLLVAEENITQQVHFPPGGLLCLERKRGGWARRWMITPENAETWTPPQS